MARVKRRFERQKTISETLRVVPVVPQTTSAKITFSTMFAINPVEEKLTSKCDASADMCLRVKEKKTNLNFELSSSLSCAETAEEKSARAKDVKNFFATRGFICQF